MANEALVDATLCKVAPWEISEPSFTSQFWHPVANGDEALKFPKKTQSEIKDLLTASKIIPDVIKTVPKGVVKVAYENNVVDFGNNLTKTISMKRPTFVEWETKPNSYYCLILVDPDYRNAHAHERLKEYDHWKVGNIPGTNITAGRTMSEYIGVQAHNGTGIHRYVFLVYEQQWPVVNYDEFHLIPFPVDDLRANFSATDFAETYELGEPVAINFFLSEWDDYPEYQGEIKRPNFPSPEPLGTI